MFLGRDRATYSIFQINSHDVFSACACVNACVCMCVRACACVCMCGTTVAQKFEYFSYLSK